MHKELKGRFLGFDEGVCCGRRTREVKSSKKLKVKEFANYLKELEALALEYEITLPHPDDYNFAMMIS
jgi:hypothetical protein